MCLATPMELIRIEEDFGYVEHDGKEYRVELSLIDDPRVGDWLLAHGELAVSRIPGNEAKKILELIRQAEHKH